MHQHEFVRDRMWYNRREGCYIRLLSTTIKLFKVFGVDHFDFKGSEMFQCMLKLSWKQEPLKPHLVICEDFLHHLHHAKRRSVDILDQINSNLGSRILIFVNCSTSFTRFISDLDSIIVLPGYIHPILHTISAIRRTIRQSGAWLFSSRLFRLLKVTGSLKIIVLQCTLTSRGPQTIHTSNYLKKSNTPYMAIWR